MVPKPKEVLRWTQLDIEEFEPFNSNKENDQPLIIKSKLIAN